jgi:hypothetical protein
MGTAFHGIDGTDLKLSPSDWLREQAHHQSRAVSLAERE